MHNIDTYAYNSKLRVIDPVDKVSVTLITLGVCLMMNKVTTSVSVMLVMMYIITVKGWLPLKVLLKAMCIPLGFLFLSIVTLLFEFGISDQYRYSFMIGEMIVGITLERTVMGIGLFFKVLASMTCLYFLIFTTPMPDILQALIRMRCPKLLVEMMHLIYRFIFILIERVQVMKRSQESRLGYSTIKLSFKSMGNLLGTLFLRALQMNQKIYIAMESRCYTGNLNVISNVQHVRLQFVKIIGLEMLFIIIGILS